MFIHCMTHSVCVCVACSTVYADRSHGPLPVCMRDHMTGHMILYLCPGEVTRQVTWSYTYMHERSHDRSHDLVPVCMRGHMTGHMIL